MANRERPYRSHLRPACVSCRQRKSRCKSGADGEVCLSCQMYGTDCVYPNAEDRQAQQTGRLTNNPLGKRKHAVDDSDHTEQPRVYTANDLSTLQHHSQPITSPRVSVSDGTHAGLDLGSNFEDQPEPKTPTNDHLAENDHSIHHIVGPTPAFDHDVLQKYLSSVYIPSTPKHPVGSARALGHVSSDETATPVMFDTIQKRPLGVSDRQSLAASKCEIVEKVVGVPAQHLIDLYLKVVNRVFPLFDESSFRRVFQDSKTNISPALLSNLYAAALPYWSQSSDLSSCRRPDVRFIWVQAGEALYSELWHAPSMSVIIAIILNTNGRPSTSMLGNGGLLGFAVSLAHGLGLNRNPRGWQTSQVEKSLRIRIWWLLVVFDKWQSLGYGTPSRIRWSQFDVPYPTLEELNINNESPNETRLAGSIYIAFLTLTEVLDQCLEYIYCLDEHTRRSFTKQPPDLELTLRQWEESLEDQVREIIIHGANLDLPGATNFRLAYLGTRLFLCKIQLDLDVKSSQTASSFPNNDTATNNTHDPLSWRLMQSQRAAEDIVYFVKQLRAHHLTGFWSPVCAFALTSATTFLLRRAIRWTSTTNTVSTTLHRQQSSDQQRNTPLKMARDMLDTLQRHRQDYDWDVAEDCLRRCADILKKITTTNAGSGDGDDENGAKSATAMSGTGSVGGGQIQMQIQDEGFVDQFALEDLFPDIWGMLET